VLTVSALGSSLLYGCGTTKKGTKVLTIRHSSTYTREGEEKFQDMGTYAFQKLVEEYSNGEMIVEVYPSDQLGSQRDVAEKIQAGVLEICQTSTMNMSQFVPGLNALDFPYIFNSREEYGNLLNDKYIDNLREAAEPKGIRPLWFYFNAFRAFCHRGTLVANDPASIKGLKVRTTPAAIEQEAFRLLGATPTPIDFMDTFVAMQQGVVDALHAGSPPVFTSGIYEAVGTMTKINMMTDGGMHSCSSKWYNSLSNDQKEVIDKAALEASKISLANQIEKELSVEKACMDAGVKIVELTPDEKRVWREAIGHHNPQWDNLKNEFGLDLYTKLIDLL
jgi:TRAP-type C4-dicarboxylate transport system substrate-binding protein